MIIKPTSKALLLIALLIFSRPVHAQEEEKKPTVKEVLKYYTGMYADFLSMYSVTYAGEHNASLQSVQNQFAGKAKESLEDRGYETDLSDIRELLASFMPGGKLENDLNTFQNETGVKIYLTGLISGYGGKKIPRMFNELSKMKHPEEKVAPYFEVFITQTKDSLANEYSLSAEVIPSADINLRKPDRYFNDLFEDKYASRKAARQHLKGVYMVAFTELKEKLGTQYLPDLAIKYEGVNYRPGDLFKVTQEAEAKIILTAVNKEGQAAQDIKWKVLPLEGKLLNADGNRMTLLIDEEGYWDVTASNEKHEVSVTVDVVKMPMSFDEILKSIVREVLRKAREKAEQAIAREQERQESLQDSILALEPELYPRDLSVLPPANENVQLEVSFFIEDNDQGEWLPQSRVEEMQQDEKSRQLLEAHRKRILSVLELTLQFKIEEFVMALLNDPGQFKNFIENLKEDAAAEIGAYIGKSITGNQREALKEVVVNYVNQKIEEVADENE